MERSVNIIMVKAVPKPSTDTTETTNRGIGGRGGGSAKKSGTYFENQAADYFSTPISKAKRIIGSGAFGKITRNPNLLGDVVIRYDILSKPLLVECKFGYARGESQITLKKNWFDKIAIEAEVTQKYPAVMFRFKGKRGPNSRVVAFSWDTFQEMMQEITDLIGSLKESKYVGPSNVGAYDDSELLDD